VIDHTSVTEWLNDYVAAWKSYEPQAIGSLFAESAGYWFHPFDEEPVRGRESIVANWLENRDAPGTYDAAYKAIAVDGDTAVANGRSYYYEGDGKTLTRVYENIFVIRFDAQGQCVEFREWYMQSRAR
jgi:hypothetical protein